MQEGRFVFRKRATFPTDIREWSFALREGASVAFPGSIKDELELISFSDLSAVAV